MTVTVLVPDEEGVTALSEIEGVRPVVYRRGEPVPAEAAGAEVLVTGDQPSEELWRELPNVKLVQLLVAGAEDWIGKVPDGVLLSTCRGAHGGSSAEWVVAVLLAIYRGLDGFADGLRRKHWARRTTDTLQGKRALVIGAGDLGRHLRRRLDTFDVRCTMVGATAREGVHGVGELPDLLPDHDITVLMVPLTQHTQGLVDAEFLAAMPDGAILVNVSRGPVVVTDALVAELASGRLRAALDVTDPEPLPEGHPLWDVPGLLLTPHVAGAVSGRRQRAYAVVARELSHYLSGELPNNLVHGEY
ncbi:2-hydroxyacid dehydrogenase [Amycolatopsis sp. BJA-103]|uniref:2-hydroxyacid dehydrogenase n=1 Tax=unclassified Amycolatopsis TaxID=2618356 RepID=UPI000C75F34C|nr:2-hydroxyacid dehydrogenase [Amycolatopsis sp. BJA-103]AUI64665.1 phosphoglycerate dehydrogenase [Amycolatopsis sp. BJA-103]PNE22215.1 phosphoglycerate dehydrogenase [Amycolatopsis sp. BJA-103]